MKGHWNSGDVIVLRDALTTRGTRSYEHITDDHTANLPGWPYIVLQDTAEVLALYLPEGSHLWRWNIEQQCFREPKVTQGDSVRLFFPGKRYAVDMFYETGSGPAWFVRNIFFSPGELVRGGTPVVLPEGTHFERGHFYGWKVDMIAPFSRTDLGIDVCDEVLDIVVRPDRSYLWKDTAEMEELMAKGIYTRAEYSLPPRRTQALPDLRLKAAISIVTLGRLSKIAARTPSGTLRRLTCKPLARREPSISSPIGSGKPATVRTSAAMAAILSGES